MKILFLFIFLSSITVAFAQPLHLHGSVVDAQTNRPIAAATISIVEKSLFYPADDAGKFDISSKELLGMDSIAFSCIGYRTKKIKVSDLQINTIIKLEPIVNMLKEVKIGVNTPVTIKVGSKQKSSNEMTWTLTGTDMAAFMEGSKNVKGFIQTIGFYLSNGRGYLKGGDVTAPFRIKLFAVDVDGKPGEELTKDIIIVSARKDRAWFDIDISAYHIRNPDSGFFVSFTLLNYEYYKVKKGAVTDDGSGERWATIDTSGVRHYFGAWNAADVITPRLGVSSQESKQCRCYFSGTSLQDMSWHWIKDIYHSGYMIRATIAPD
jgi:hypothetical protein